jgi:hypothetical protein
MTSGDDIVEAEVVGEVTPSAEWMPAEGQLYPTALSENLVYRYTLLEKAANPGPRGLVAREHMLELCAADALFWINSFVYTYNPRKTPSVVPFITYPYEDKLILELVARIRDQKDYLIDKSRDMGVTWCVIAVLTWFWQFGGEGFDFLVGSRKEQYIDVVGNMDTLIEKMRFILRNQPKWMLPEGFDWKAHSNYMKIINPVSKATVTGEATNNNFSRGGRRRAIFFDEFAFWEVDEAAWRASADSTNCRIVVSTPNGLSNQFAKLRFSNSIDYTSLHWKLHPEKDQAWYENECRRRNNDSVEIARELDINYEGSESGILFRWEELRSGVSNQPLMTMDRVVVAIDPAGEGDDEAVIYVGNNGNIVERKFFKKSSAEVLAAECVMLIRKYKAQVMIGDAIGNDVLAVVSTLLGDSRNRVKIVAVKNSEKASDPVKFYNRRAEVYYTASQQIKGGLVQVDDDHTLMTQLNATHYTTKDGRLILEPKEKIREAVGGSPDRADAWVLMAWGLQFTHSRREIEAQERMRVRRNYDDVESGQEYGDWRDILE